MCVREREGACVQVCVCKSINNVLTKVDGLPVKLNWRANYAIYWLEQIYFSKSQKRSVPSLASD